MAVDSQEHNRRTGDNSRRNRAGEFFKRNPSTIAWIIAAIFIGLAFSRQAETDRKQEEAALERKQQICTTSLEDRLVILDLVDLATSDSSTPEAEAFTQMVSERIEVPPRICEGSGIDVSEFLREERSRTTMPTTRPEQPTSQPPTEREGAATSVPDGGVTVIVQPSPDQEETSTTSSTTTSTSTTTTTTRPGVYLPPVTIPLATQMRAILWSGWSVW